VFELIRREVGDCFAGSVIRSGPVHGPDLERKRLARSLEVWREKTVDFDAERARRASNPIKPVSEDEID
jgi:hypothetical protein